MPDETCEVEVELNDSGPLKYVSDEMISGHVRVVARAETNCEKLTLNLRRTIHGAGNTRTDIVKTEPLFSGKWEAGEAYDYPFELTLPGGPVSYRGHHLNIDWDLVAAAENQNAADASTTAEFHLQPGPTDSFSLGSVTEEAHLSTPVKRENGIFWPAVWFGGIAIIIGLVLAFQLRQAPTGVLALIIVGSSAFGAWCVYRGLKNYLAEKRLGDVDVEVSPNRVAPGESITCNVMIRPAGASTLNQVSLTVEAFELVTQDQGTYQASYRHTVHEETKASEPTADKTLEKASPTTVSETFSIPESAPCSFEENDNRLIWKTTVCIDIPYFPDWERDERFIVAPPAGNSPSN